MIIYIYDKISHIHDHNSPVKPSTAADRRPHPRARAKWSARQWCACAFCVAFHTSLFGVLAWCLLCSCIFPVLFSGFVCVSFRCFGFR